LNREVVLHDTIAINRSKIPEIMSDEESLDKIRFYNRFKKYGFAYKDGWAAQPARHLDIIETLDREAEKISAWLKKELKSRS
jgi:hypothetical protein